jgi:hypothetical protein
MSQEETMGLSEQDTRDGLVVGLIAYASVAVFYSAFDFLAARGTLYTVNLLGQAVFRGLRDPGVLQYPVPLDRTAIFLYNGLHLVLSLAIGLVVMRFVGQAERQPALARPMLLLVVSGFVVTIIGVGALSTSIRSVLPWWSILVANSLAVTLAALYVGRRRPGIWGRLVLVAGASES